METAQRRRVLVLDADMVPALTIVRSLARRDCVLDTASSVRRPITGYSSAIRSTFIYPDPLLEETAFLQWLVAHTRATAYDLLIPVTERSLVAIARSRHLFEHVKIAMPSQQSLDLALDKEQTMALAERLEVPVPVGVAVSSMAELNRELPSIAYPVVLKPARSVGSNEKGSSQLKVSYAFDETELRAGCEHGLKFGPILLQQYFRGQGVGIELIACQGEIAYAFQHLRLHEVPLTGGGSSLRKSVVIEPLLLDASRRLIEALEWNGVAMVEFKWNAETNAFSLMEINGRFWGSLPLADAAGADFPSMLLDLELEGRVTPGTPYRPDIYCRKLSSDLYWYEAVMRGGEDERITDIPPRKVIMRELALVFSRKHNFDVQSWRDPIPGLVDIGWILSSYWHRFSCLFRDKLFLWRQRRAWQRGEVASAISSAHSILFLCYGNINRSALADVLTRGYAEDLGVRVSSAGFHSTAGRPADPVMVEVASAHGTDLSASRSVPLTAELLQTSDIIFAMEKAHIDRLRSMDPASAKKTWLLGAHPGGARSGTEIADPYGRARGKYETCYQQVSDAVDRIKSVLVCRQGR